MIRGSRSFIFRENESTPKSQSHSMFVTSQVRSKSCVSVCSDCERQHDRRDNRCYSNVTARLCDKVKTPSEVKSIDNINQLGCYLRFLYLVWLTSLTIEDGMSWMPRCEKFVSIRCPVVKQSFVAEKDSFAPALGGAECRGRRIEYTPTA